VTGLRRFPIIAIAALLAAGCGATLRPGATSAPPSGSAAPTPTPSSTPLPAPTRAWSTLAPLTSPAPGCTALADIDLGRLEVELSSLYPSGNGGFGGFSLGHVNGRLQVTRVTELSGEAASAVPPPVTLGGARGQMLGGREFVTYPSTFGDGSYGPQKMIKARVTLSLADASPIDLPTRFVPGNENFDQVAVAVPDVSGRGEITLEFEWVDDCLRYEASRTIPVDVVPLAETAGCELDEQLYWDDLGALLDRSISVGGMTPRTGSPFNESRYAPYVNIGIDAFIGYMFDPKAPELSVASGTTVRIENLKPRRLDLVGRIKVITWTRRSVSTAVKDYPPNGLVEVSTVRLEAQPDGSFELPVPDEPGRYVVAVSVDFESSCSTGTLWSVVNIATV